MTTLAASGSNQHQSHLKVFRPWQSFQSLDSVNGFQVKHLTVNPGTQLSLQKHNHWAEHWVMVRDTARVTRGEEVFDLAPSPSTHMPLGVQHRLEYPGTEPVGVIEIQPGDDLGEDDIVCFDDVYGRSEI